MNPAWDKILARLLYCLGTVFMKVFWRQWIDRAPVDYENNNRVRIRERVEWIFAILPFWLCIFIKGYYLQSSIFWVLVMRVLHQKNLTVLESLPLFEIVFAVSVVLYHQCCAALSCIATPVSYCNLCCVAEILSLVCMSVKQ